MPNWVFCNMKVSGPAAEITRFVDAHMGKPINWPPIKSPSGATIWEDTEYRNDPTDYFCFNAFIPCPEEVVSRGYDSIRSGEPLDGYHWSMKNWGCKWDIWGTKLTREKIGYCGDGCTNLKLEFATANTPPMGWLGAVMQSFPALQINFDCCCWESRYGFSFYSFNGQRTNRIWSSKEIEDYFGFSEDE